MKLVKRMICLIMLFALVCPAFGCAAANTGKNRDGKPLIGISMCSLLVERWYKDRNAFTAELSRLDADVIVQNANNDVELQAEQIDDLLDRGIDVLIVIPVSSTAFKDQLSRALRSGVKVISYERLIENLHTDAYYSFDNVRVGELLALGLLDGMAEGELVLINGDRNDHNTELYREGYMHILQPHIDSGRIRIAGDVYCADWEVEHAYNEVERLLGDNVHIDGIIATNDSLAGSAIQVLLEKGIADSVVVVGQDGDLAAYQRIVEGVQHATVYKNYTKLASAAALAAYRMSGDKPFAYSEKIDNGGEMIKYYKLSPQLVTKDNIDKVVIDGGVYTADQVYMNVVG